MARVYNGTSGDHLDTSATAVTAYGITSCIWIKLDPAQIGVTATLFCPMGTSGSGFNRLFIFLAASGAIGAAEFDGTSQSNSVTPNLITDSTTWHLCVATHNSASQRFSWLDNGTKNQSAAAKTTTFGGISRIGSSPAGGGPFKGKMCYATIWNTVLTDNQIQNLWYNPPWAIAPGNIVEFWPDVQGASPVTSLGSNPHSMTVTGTTVDQDYPAFPTPSLGVVGVNQNPRRGPQFAFKGLQPDATVPPAPGPTPVWNQIGYGPFRGIQPRFQFGPGQVQNTPVAASGLSAASTYAAGAMTGAEAVSGVSVFSSELIALLGGTGALSGTTVTTSDATGSMTGAAALSGISVTTRNLTGQIGGTMAFSGASAFTSEATGAAAGAAALSGVSVGTSTTVGGIGGSGALSGISVATSNLIGNLALNAFLTGLAPFSTEAIGAMTGAAAIAGTSQTDSEAIGALLGSIPLSGIAVGGSWLIGNLALNLILTGVASTTSDATGQLTGLASIAATNPALFAFAIGQMSSLAGVQGIAATFSHARGNLTSGIISSFQRVWVGDAMISGAAQSVAVFSN